MKTAFIALIALCSISLVSCSKKDDYAAPANNSVVCPGEGHGPDYTPDLNGRKGDDRPAIKREM